jgi:hypothetical protein
MSHCYYQNLMMIVMMMMTISTKFLVTQVVTQVVTQAVTLDMTGARLERLQGKLLSYISSSSNSRSSSNSMGWQVALHKVTHQMMALTRLGTAPRGIRISPAVTPRIAAMLQQVRSAAKQATAATQTTAQVQVLVLMKVQVWVAQQSH